MNTSLVTLTNGRQLAVLETGAPDGFPLFFAHGCPGSRLEGQFFHGSARAAGFRIITPDRPGIGASPGDVSRSLLDDAADILALADTLSIERFGVFGWSSGGPVALACAWAFPQRLAAVVSMSGYTNFQEFPQGRDLLLRSGWPLPKLAQWSDALFRLALGAVVVSGRWLPELYFRAVLSTCGESDRRILRRPEPERLFRADQREAFRSRLGDLALELETQHNDWGFPMRAVRMPVKLFQGDDDHFVPVALAEHQSAQLPDADLEILPGAGHMYPLDTLFQQRLFRYFISRIH